MPLISENTKTKLYHVSPTKKYYIQKYIYIIYTYKQKRKRKFKKRLTVTISSVVILQNILLLLFVPLCIFYILNNNHVISVN